MGFFACKLEEFFQQIQCTNIGIELKAPVTKEKLVRLLYVGRLIASPYWNGVKCNVVVEFHL